MFEVTLSIGNIIIGKGESRDAALKEAEPAITAICKYNTNFTTTIRGPEYLEAIIWSSYKFNKAV